MQSSIKPWIWAGLFSALTAVGAFIRIPLPYVPFTLQVVFVLLAGDILPPKFAALSQFVYIMIGLLGIPVFANGGGLVYVLQPTFGYLAAFPVASWLVALILQNRLINKSWKNKLNFIDFILANSIGVVVIFVIGVAYLFLNVNMLSGTSLSLPTAIWSGAIVFLPGDIIKILLASLLAVEMLDRLKQLA